MASALLSAVSAPSNTRERWPWLLNRVRVSRYDSRFTADHLAPAFARPIIAPRSARRFARCVFAFCLVPACARETPFQEFDPLSGWFSDLCANRPPTLEELTGANIGLVRNFHRIDQGLVANGYPAHKGQRLRATGENLEGADQLIARGVPFDETIDHLACSRIQRKTRQCGADAVGGDQANKQLSHDVLGDRRADIDIPVSGRGSNARQGGWFWQMLILLQGVHDQLP